MPALKKIILKLADGSFMYLPEMNNLLVGKRFRRGTYSKERMNIYRKPTMSFFTFYIKIKTNNSCIKLMERIRSIYFHLIRNDYFVGRELK